MKYYCVMGNPIEHSKSPQIHQFFAKQFNLNIEYTKNLVPLNSFKEAVNDFFKLGGVGANVTLPFKEEAFSLCNHVSKSAKLAQSVNTLFIKDNLLCGDNTDGIGLVEDLKKHQINLANKKILLIGAGGASKGVIPALLIENIKHLHIVNRTYSKAQKIQKHMQTFNYHNISCSTFLEIPNMQYDIIINATSLSVQNSIPEVSKELFHSNSICYDMMYQKNSTVFLKFAKNQGAIKTIDGLGMLLYQAKESFRIWNSVMPSCDGLYQLLKDQL